MSGTIVERRDQVLMTFRSRVVFRAATFFVRWSSTKAPFLIERAMSRPSLSLRLATADDEVVRPLVVSRLRALRLPAPGRSGMPSTGRLPFAAAHRVVDGVHRHAADVRPAADPPVAAGLADRDVLVLDVDFPDFPGGKPDLRVAPLFRHELRGRAGGTNELAAPPTLQLEVVDRRAERDPAQRQRVARQDVRGRPGYDLGADVQAVRREYVALLAVDVVEERDPSRPVRVVLDRRDLGRNPDLVPAEVDDPVETLVSAPHVAGRHAALRVPSAGRAHADRQRLLRTLVRDLLERQRRLKTPPRRGRVVLFERHLAYTPSKNSIGFSPGASRTYAFFQALRWPTNLPMRFHFPSRLATRTSATLTPKSVCTARAISILLASRSTSKHTVLVASFSRVAFSVMSGRRITRCGSITRLPAFRRRERARPSTRRPSRGSSRRARSPRAGPRASTP